MKKLLKKISAFFFPPDSASRWTKILPYAVLGLLTLALVVGGTYGWEYSNSPEFCGTSCHTMPPQDIVYLKSPHANVTCEECHIGRTSFANQLTRKSQGLHELYYMVFSLYEYPIRAKALRPALDTCEKCHHPETFSDDSLRTITHFADDAQNTKTNTYLVVKIGGGSEREGLGKGIHWHIANKVMYYASDDLNQTIPYVRVYNEDGTFKEYKDVESDFDPATIDESQLQPMDCVTCHNRITHNFEYPASSVDDSMSRGVIDPSIPFIHQKAVEVLMAKHETHDDAVKSISALEEDYKNNFADFYSLNSEKIQMAIAEIQAIYDRTVFHDQKVDWTTHPNNLGHITDPGCFRCHDGQHLDTEQQAIRLECNICHAIPVVSGSRDFLTTININRGPEPESHLNANWISLHRLTFDATCANCHTTGNPGGVSNSSFCSNSACHGLAFSFAGFDAPKLREILQAQLPTPAPGPSPAPVVGNPTYVANIQPLLAAKCAACHGAVASAGLNVTTYVDLLKGGNNGVVIIPGDSAESKLIVVQAAGQHFANFDAEELSLFKAWIDAGALEK